MNEKLLVRFGLGYAILSFSNPTLAQSVLTWATLQSSVQNGEAQALRSLIPMQFPSEFSSGQFAISALHTGRTTYVVTKAGKSLSNVSIVSQQTGRNISFNAANGHPELTSMPALTSFPTQLYNSGQLVEVSRYAARYDNEGTRARARQAQKSTLPNGRNAYYLKQDTGRKGWCAFELESARHSPFICVNVANSSTTALNILKSMLFQ